MISVDNVSKNFGEFTALNKVSFEIGKGEIVGFLGQNGAGKTTLMRILTTYLAASSGKVRVAGFDARNCSLEIRRCVGYLPETPPLYPTMTVKDYLKFSAQLKEIPCKRQNFHIDQAMEKCDISDVSEKTIGILSKGYKQRVGLAQAIINDPEILILDEPTNGLDPVQIQKVRGLIKNLEHKRTVLISTHILSEIEQIALRVLIIKSGEIIVDDNLDDLLEKNQGRSLEEVFLKVIEGEGPDIYAKNKSHRF